MSSNSLLLDVHARVGSTRDPLSTLHECGEAVLQVSVEAKDLGGGTRRVSGGARNAGSRMAHLHDLEYGRGEKRQDDGDQAISEKDAGAEVLVELGVLATVLLICDFNVLGESWVIPGQMFSSARKR